MQNRPKTEQTSSELSLPHAQSKPINIPKRKQNYSDEIFYVSRKEETKPKREHQHIDLSLFNMSFVQPTPVCEDDQQKIDRSANTITFG